jgi:hypothetical protein
LPDEEIEEMSGVVTPMMPIRSPSRRTITGGAIATVSERRQRADNVTSVV